MGKVKIAVLGGAGDMGSQIVEDLVQQEEVEEVLVADFNKKKAQELARALGRKAKVAFVDANDEESVKAIVAGYDSAVSAIGPFYHYEFQVAQAVIKAGVPYVSLCDDFDATEAVLKLDGLAKEKGLPLISGCGWTPGLSNILVNAGIASVPEAEEVKIAWSGDAADSEGLAVIQHTLHIFTGSVKTYAQGRWGFVPAGSGKEIVEFPEPIGKIPVFHVGHPEPVTLPRTFPQLKKVSLKGGLTPAWLNGLAKLIAHLKLTNTPQKKKRLAHLVKLGSGSMKIGGKKISGLVVEVKGKKKVTYRVADKMRRLTGIPASICALMCAQKEITKAGVIFPEAAVPTELFLKALSQRNIHIEQVS